MTTNLTKLAETLSPNKRQLLELLLKEKKEKATKAESTAEKTAAVKIPRDVLARYVGVYKGIYGRAERTYDVSLSGDQLIARIVGPAIEGGLAAAGLEAGAPRRLVPLTQTVFEGDGLAYQFEIGDTGPATALIVIHISGPYRYARQP